MMTMSCRHLNGHMYIHELLLRQYSSQPYCMHERERELIKIRNRKTLSLVFPCMTSSKKGSLESKRSSNEMSFHFKSSKKILFVEKRLFDIACIETMSAQEKKPLSNWNTSYYTGKRRSRKERSVCAYYAWMRINPNPTIRHIHPFLYVNRADNWNNNIEINICVRLHLSPITMK